MPGANVDSLALTSDSGPTVVKLIDITNGGPTANPSPTQNLAVFREICKYVYRSETSPNTATVRSTYQTMWARAINREFWSLAVRSGEIARITVYALEAYGIFKIGEIIGRRSLVRYNFN
ncbi:hypothetical protein D9758_015043 [Tetrapyrgos nigripes]|uniref:Uncharacterized protein n=1 Tax=Tetrapyrgos nigripes TaxID=182062 RepID=A0A8H5CSZ1_9AGAR|nr:hypothetical protein D9758_015043 [Tetrapyrgos nigripes]